MKCAQPRHPIERLPEQRESREHQPISLLAGSEDLEEHEEGRDHLRGRAHDICHELKRLPHDRLAPRVVRGAGELPLDGGLPVRRQVEARASPERVQRVPPPDAGVERRLDPRPAVREKHAEGAAEDATRADAEQARLVDRAGVDGGLGL